MVSKRLKLGPNGGREEEGVKGKHSREGKEGEGEDGESVEKMRG